jgi:hypothetical protein
MELLNLAEFRRYQFLFILSAASTNLAAAFGLLFGWTMNLGIVRAKIVSEYFQLRDHLNRANRNANQTTKFTFEIAQVSASKYELFVVSRGKNEVHRIAIAGRSVNSAWERSGRTKFGKFEEFCAHCMNEIDVGADVPMFSSKLSDMLKTRLERAVSSKIEMLLLNESYEP